MKKWDTDRNGGSKPNKLILQRYNTKPMPTFCLKKARKLKLKRFIPFYPRTSNPEGNYILVVLSRPSIF